MANITGYDKIINHPDKDEIIEKLIAGDSVRQVSQWLKQKYPSTKKNEISFVSLQSFRKNYLNLEKDVLKDLQKERKQFQIQKREEGRQDQVSYVQTYQAGLNNYVQESLIDYNAEMLTMLKKVKDGIDHLDILNDEKGSHLNHQAISAYLKDYKSLLELHHKMLEDQKKTEGDKLEEDYELLTKRMDLLIESVKEAFVQTNPEGLTVFIQLVKEKMQDAGLSE